MKRNPGIRHRVALAIGLAAATALCASAAVQALEGHDEDRGDRHDESQIKRGFEPVPPGVALNMVGKNRALVGLGSYLVNTSGCIATSPRSSPASATMPAAGSYPACALQSAGTEERWPGSTCPTPGSSAAFAANPGWRPSPWRSAASQVSHRPTSRAH